jgi:hypothetical protein
MVSRRAPSRALQLFLRKATAAGLLAVGLVSGVLGILQVIDARYLFVAGIALLGLCGWAAAFYVSYSDRVGVSPADRLLQSICELLQIPYLETWLRSTLLNQVALGLYWNANKTLRVKEISCNTVLTMNDAELSIAFKGINESRQPEQCCPMLMFGGSVIHLPLFQQTAVSRVGDTEEIELDIHNVLDLGQLHYVEVSFSVPLERNEEFDIEHRHVWPGGMAEGEDTLWYPYAALFDRAPSSMIVRVTFSEPPSYLRGIRASMKSRTCETSERQPKLIPKAGNAFEWLIDPVDNDCLYALVFKRTKAGSGTASVP